MSQDMQRIKFRVSGEVQGVGLRAWITAQAQQHDLSGWVRNENDGSVAVLFIGPQPTIADANGWLRLGSDGADIVDVCELLLEPVDLAWDIDAGFSILGNGGG